MKRAHPESLAAKILTFLKRVTYGKWTTWGESFYMPSVQQVFPVGTKGEVQMRFMRRMINKGLVAGCGCGCRGDYEITDIGENYLNNHMNYKAP